MGDGYGKGWRMAGRVIGKRRERPPGPRWPTQAEIDASMEHALAAPRVVPKGVYVYRGHAAANADSERWSVDALVKRARQLARLGERRAG